MKQPDWIAQASETVRNSNPHIFGGKHKKTRPRASVGSRNGKRGEMNKTESEFALILEARRRAGEIYQWRFESIKLKLADNCWYTPDFFIEREARLIFIEIKGGHIWDDSKVKFKTAKEIHRWADFEMYQKTKTGWKKIL